MMRLEYHAIHNFFTNSAIKIAKPFSSTPQYDDLKVGNEVVRIHFLPYITPAIVRQEYPEHSEKSPPILMR